LKEFGDKLSEPNKTAIEGALATLKEAHQKQDLAAIDTALEALNGAWQNASQEMYAAQEAAGGAEGADPTGGAGDDAPEGDASADDGVSDVEYEEVDDKK